MKRGIFLGLIGLILIWAVFAGFSKAQQPSGGGGPAGAGGPPPAPKVSVAKPLLQPVDSWKDFSGRFDATDTVDVRSRISGYLTSIHFKDGAMVNKGELLFVIDPRTLEATLRQKQADLKLAQSQTNLRNNDFERAQALFNTGDISAQILDQRRAARDQAKAAVDSAKAAVDSAQVDLTYAKIVAPITGRIGRQLVTEGNLINPGQQVLATIVSMDPIYFYFDIDEQTYLDYARAHPDQTKDNVNIPVKVALSDENDYRHDGTLDFIDNALDTGTGTMRARAVLANPKLYFAPGMFGRVRILTGHNAAGVLIPDEAISIDQSRKFVYVADAQNKVTTRNVVTGQIFDGLRVITSGLDGSERIVINGLQRVHEGATIDAEEVPIKPASANADAQLPPPEVEDANTQ